MTRNPDYFVDGQPLDDPEWRWRLLRATGMPAAAGKRTAQLSLLQRPGVTVRRGAFDVGSLKVVLLLPEVGVREGLPTESFDVRLSQSQSLLLRAATVERVTHGGLSLQVGVVDVTLSDPAEVSRGRWQVEAVFTLQPFWVERPGVLRGAVLVGGRPRVDAGDSVLGTAVPLSAQDTSLAPAVFPEWAGTTGDVVEGVLRVRGPLTKAVITAADGSGASFERALTASQYVFIDLASFTAWAGGSADWGPTATPVLLDYPAAGPLRVSPSVEGVVLTMTGTGFTAGTTGLQLRAQKYWL